MRGNCKFPVDYIPKPGDGRVLAHVRTPGFPSRSRESPRAAPMRFRCPHARTYVRMCTYTSYTWATRAASPFVSLFDRDSAAAPLAADSPPSSSFRSPLLFSSGAARGRDRGAFRNEFSKLFVLLIGRLRSPFDQSRPETKPVRYRRYRLIDTRDSSANRYLR